MLKHLDTQPSCRPVLLVHDWFWGAGAMHTDLIPLIPVLSRDAPEMEPDCMSRISP